MPSRAPIPRHAPIDPNVWVAHRERLAALLPPGSAAIVHANEHCVTNGDGVFPFVQDSDFFYLTGIAQPKSALLLFPSAPNPVHRMLLFVDLPTPSQRAWAGPLHTLESAKEVSGMAHVHPYSAFFSLLQRVMSSVQEVYLPSNEHPRVENQGSSRWLLDSCKERHPLHTYRRLAPLMRQLRAVKDGGELMLLRQACQITCKGFQEMAAKLRPGVMEYALEASLASSFLSRGAQGFSYAPIVASGSNACILHYEANSSPCHEGELVLIDAGAVYGGYHADVTRVLPVSGRFTKRQREVYEAVWRLLQAAQEMLLPGITLADYHKQVGVLAGEEMVGLGLLTMAEVRAQDPLKPAYRRYLMHGISHHLGLETHDVADLDRPLEEGMVLTVEPGIYLPEEGIGIRLENDVVVREGGVENLTADVPLAADEVEALVQGRL